MEIPDLKNTYVIITGIGGFLGRRLARVLASAGVDVAGLDLPVAAKAMPKDIACDTMDILDSNGLSKWMAGVSSKTKKKITVFHLAGMSHVGRCAENPTLAFAYNVTGTNNLLEACRQSQIARFIFPSTALVYSLPAESPLDENAPIDPCSFYATTKCAAEIMIKGYSQNYGLDTYALRLANVYGEDGPTDSIVSILLRQVHNGGPIAIRTTSPVRDFIYRDDVVNAMVSLVACSGNQGHKVFNVSSGKPTSIGDLARLACKVGGVSPVIQETKPKQTDFEDKVVLVNRKMREYTNWEPRWSLEDGLRNTLKRMEI